MGIKTGLVFKNVFRKMDHISCYTAEGKNILTDFPIYDVHGLWGKWVCVHCFKEFSYNYGEVTDSVIAHLRQEHFEIFFESVLQGWLVYDYGVRTDD